jgi:TPR repeat protein/virulence-associated protein VagC
MRKAKVLFFTADPSLGRPHGQALQLPEDLRQIMRRVREARYGHRLVFEPHGAARADDLIDLLDDTDAQVMHFSGHGGKHGLVLVARGGHDPHPVDAAALRQLFHTYHGSVRLAVLSACSSHAEAQAIADVVGCAIGTLNDIADEAAITFNSRFYQAIANGDSVQRAYNKARTALQVHRVPESEYPQVFHRKDVDPAKLVLVKTIRLVPHRVFAATSATVLAWAWVTDIVGQREAPQLTVSDIACGSESLRSGNPLLTTDSQGAASTTPNNSVGAAEDLATGKAFYRDRNYAAAKSAFEAAAAAGNGEAMGCLGYMYLAGRGMAPQPATGIKWLRDAARDERDAHGMYALANAYLDGHGGSRVQHLAEEWLKKSAEKGYAEAMRSLGDLARRRMNDSSYRQAVSYYQQAVDSGSVDAKVDLGSMYEFGWGVEQNSSAALQLYRSVAEAGSPRGMFVVGQSYQKGVGVSKDYRQAMIWYRKAVRAGWADAMNSIGVLYDNGLGVRKSHARARRWYKRAAEAGSVLGRVNLAGSGRG